MKGAANLISKFSARQPSANQNATRLRDNQRRHRARVKAYTAELEKRLEEAESRLDDALQKIARLTSEVERLRGGHVIERQANTDPNSTSRMARARSRPPTVAPLPTDGEVQSLCPFSGPIIPGIASLSIRGGASVGGSNVPRALQTVHALSQGTAADLPGVPGSPIGGEIPRPECSSSCDQDQKHGVGEAQALQPDVLLVMMSGRGCDCLPVLQSGESTIPCDTAYKVIEQQNTFGLDAAAITRWLQPGFRKAPGKGVGCLVDTQLLFALLDYITSSNGL
jgi:hypothetical protein